MQYTEKDLLRYIWNKETVWIMIIAGTVGVIVGIIWVPKEPDLTNLFILLFGIVVLVKGIWHLIAFGLNIDRARKEGLLEEYLADFNRGQFLIGENVRLGEDYIFGKEAGFPVPYSSLIRVYQQAEESNGREQERALLGVIGNGRTVTICQLECNGASNEELKKILAVILSKNPAVKIGPQ